METSLGNIWLKLYEDTPLHRENLLKLVREGYYNGILFHRVIQHFMIQAGDPESKHAHPDMLLGEGDIGYTIPAEILPKHYHKRGVLAAAREGDEVNPARESSGSHFYIVQGKVFTPESLNREIEKINNRRYTALFNRIKAGREGEIEKYQLADDYENLMRINQEISDSTRSRFEKVKLELSEEQRQIYLTQGGTPHLDGEYTVFGEVIEGMEIIDKIAAVQTDENDRPETDVIIQKIEIVNNMPR